MDKPAYNHIPDFVAPAPCADGRLGIRVFLSGPKDCDDLKEKLIALLAEMSSAPRSAASFESRRWQEFATGVSHAVQPSTMAQLPVPLAEFQVVIGVTRHRIGEKTIEELDLVVDSPAPRPFVLFFFAGKNKERSTTEEDKARYEQMVYKDALQKIHDTVAFPFDDERDLKNQVKHELEAYVNMQLSARGNHAAPAPAAPAEPVSEPLDKFPVYVGLAPYGRKNAQHFFGRNAEIGEYLAIIESDQYQTLLLKGSSGVGKSSLMLAGVLPQLRGAAAGKPRNYLFMAPETDPFESLVRAISKRRSSLNRLSQRQMDDLAERMAKSPMEFARELQKAIESHGKRVLYIDQLEELLVETGEAQSQARTVSVERKRAFVEGLNQFLARDPSRNFVVATIRSDYLPLMSDAAWRPLTALFESNRNGQERWLLLPGNSAEFDNIVLGPCRRAGFTVDERLLKALRKDLGVDSDKPTCWPPLLSACLEEMVELVRASEDASAHKRLSLEHYKQVGGIHHIIRRRAEFTESTLPREQLSQLPNLFELLVRLDHSSGQPTKARFRLDSLASALRLLAGRLLAHRLLADDGQVELIHDALFDEWPKLARWIGKNREPLLDNLDFRSRADVWAKLARPERKLAPFQDLNDPWTGLRTGAKWAQLDPNARDWIAASHKEALVEILGRSRDPNTGQLLKLVKAGVRLDRETIDKLEADVQPFYYALYPDQAPAQAVAEPGAPAVPEDTDAHGAKSDFDDSKEADPGVAPDSFAYFNAGHLALKLGQESGFRIQHMAALGGNVDLLAHLQRLGGNLEEPSDTNVLPLGTASFAGNRSAVAYLLSQSPDPVAAILAPSKLRRNCVHWAVMAGAVDIVQLLIDALNGDADFDVHDSEGWTPLLCTAYLGDVASARAILASGRATLPARSMAKYGILTIAIDNLRWESAQWLLDAVDAPLLELDTGYDPNNFGVPLSALLYRWEDVNEDADRASMEAIFQRILEQGADPTLLIGPDRVPLLCLAAQYGALPMLQALLPRVDAAATDRKGWSALHHALANGHEACALRLLQEPTTAPVPGVAPDAPQPLQQALDAGLDDVVQVLLERRDPHAPWGAESAFAVRALVRADTSPQTRLRQGQAIERLLDHGMPPPRFSRFRRDPAGRIDGVELVDRPPPSFGVPPGDEPMPPVIAGDWQWLDAHAALALLARCVSESLLSLHDLERYRPSFARRLRLPFYDDGELIEVGVVLPADGRLGTLVMLRVGDSLVRLQGKSPVLHEVNAKAPIKIADAEMARLYLKLFCAVVHGEEGAFRVLDALSYVQPMSDADPDPVASAQPYCAEPDLLEGPHDDGHFRFDCHVVYSTAVFKATLAVLPSGMAQMESDDPRLADLPIQNEVFVDGVRVWTRRTALPHKPAKEQDSVDPSLAEEPTAGVPEPLQQALDAGLDDVVQGLLQRRDRDAPWGSEPALAVRTLARVGTSPQIRLRQGQSVERLLDHGMPPPRFSRFRRDAAGRIDGVELVDRPPPDFGSPPGDEPMPPVIPGAWQWLDAPDALALLTRCVRGSVLTLHDLERYRPSFARRLRLPFYDDGELFEVGAVLPADGRLGTLVMLRTGARLVRLRGASPVLHEVNAEAPVKIADAEIARQYLKFFCAVVHGEEGAFRVLDGTAYVQPMSGADPDPVALVRPYCVDPDLPDGPTSEGHFRFHCQLLYSTDVSEATLAVLPTGMAQMESDHNLLAGLQVQNEVFVDGVRVWTQRTVEPLQRAEGEGGG